MKLYKIQNDVNGVNLPQDRYKPLSYEQKATKIQLLSQQIFELSEKISQYLEKQKNTSIKRLNTIYRKRITQLKRQTGNLNTRVSRLIRLINQHMKRLENFKELQPQIQQIRALTDELSKIEII
jgi:endonuclease III-like uncharacterized protein